MDAKRFGSFVAACRRENDMTQAGLAAKLHVTDKAVSRWERGVGFPDIGTLEPLAAALGISVLELMRSEKIMTDEMPRSDAADAIADTLNAIKFQRRQERKNALLAAGLVFAAVVLVLFCDSLGWQPDVLLFTGFGVVLPLFCLSGFFALLGSGIWRKVNGKPCGLTFALAAALLLLLLAFMGLLLLAGAFGAGPVPN